jgi:hypothetical protein
MWHYFSKNNEINCINLSENRLNNLHWSVLWVSWILGLPGLRISVPPSTLLGLAELAIEKIPESAWLAGESLLFVSRGDTKQYKFWVNYRYTKINKIYEIFLKRNNQLNQGFNNGLKSQLSWLAEILELRKG